MKTELVKIENPDAKNLIIGQSHFIKTVEDLHEALVNGVLGIQFGLAFCEDYSEPGIGGKGPIVESFMINNDRGVALPWGMIGGLLPLATDSNISL